MYVIIVQENHPDKFITDVIGPFTDWDEANTRAVLLEEDSTNRIPGYGYRNHFDVEFVSPT